MWLYGSQVHSSVRKVNSTAIYIWFFWSDCLSFSFRIFFLGVRLNHEPLRNVELTTYFIPAFIVHAISWQLADSTESGQGYPRYGWIRIPCWRLAPSIRVIGCRLGLHWFGAFYIRLYFVRCFCWLFLQLRTTEFRLRHRATTNSLMIFGMVFLPYWHILIAF